MYIDNWITLIITRIDTNLSFILFKRDTNAHILTSQITSLHLHQSLSIFYKYFFGRCSEELSHCVPVPKNWGCNTRLASSLHKFWVEVRYPRIDWYNSCVFSYAANLWNSLPSSVFPSFYNLSSSNCRVYRHLRGIDWISHLISLYFYVLFNCVYI